MRKTLFWLSTLVLGGTSVRPRKDLKANIISQNNAQRELCRKKQLQFRNQFPDVLLNIAGREVPAEVKFAIARKQCNGAPFDFFVVETFRVIPWVSSHWGAVRTNQELLKIPRYVIPTEFVRSIIAWSLHIFHKFYICSLPLSTYSKLNSLVVEGTLFRCASIS